ncbi:tagatose-bisphosphate aldolase [Streptococcus chenjunshii]|uniref:Tagatose 1,6-diphosphate aldolase n=1 Tax=Streptococcus chenjunshii TaxID=2173853 RepID=A0A372KPJ8_9STRE|nr:tagatose-bisphosphate aldolase [Streptococcus chenjunshii]AXQ77948.1 tagatose-bisphosphate aldolase [Streptococcus chenjunshii]RFU51808.1 tagatose-bisphosphate aldolase [Streptococcus chenjunshii]RFU53896.1 tagatose-bisphosphate aldolase [Streptococcus chenjunshii]
MAVKEEKKRRLTQLSDSKGLISALAFDQRGALKKMIQKYQTKEVSPLQITELKSLVSEELTGAVSAILLDPEYGLPAAKARAAAAGLLLAYEQTGYGDTVSRLPTCLSSWSVKRLKEAGAAAVKFLLYYDADGDTAVNQQKQAYIERIGAECQAEQLPFFLEILSYDEKISDKASPEFAKLKPQKVNGAMAVFSNQRFNVDILKVEVPLNMDYVEGFTSGRLVVYSRQEAVQAFRDQEAAASLPYIYLSAGVSARRFQETLIFAYESGAKFSGVLCGRASWGDVVPIYIESGKEAARQWLQSQGRKNIDTLNTVLQQTAIPWKEKWT